MPLGSLEEVDKVDAKRLFGLTHLPVFGAAVLLEFFAEAPNLIGQRLVRGRARQKPPDPADEVRRGLRPSQLSLEQELAELLQ
jgi:hypothetical protein